MHSARFRKLSVLLRIAWLGFELLHLWLTRRFTLEYLYVGIRELIEGLSGLWIKAGQLASLRIDLFPLELCRELAKLQNRATGFSTDQVRKILQDELRRPLGSVFDHFEERPLAAASIGQVHRAHLREEDLWVAVKVQRPNIAEVYARDVELMRLFASFLKFIGFFPHARWHEAVWEIELVMVEELDYRYEGAYAKQMRRSLRPHGILAPRIHAKYTTSRVLVMEFMQGALMSDYLELASRDPAAAKVWRKQNGIKPKKLATTLLRSLMWQIFEDNLFHGDLHPGNIMLLRGGKCALIDFGTCGFTEAAFLHKWQELFRSFGTRELTRIADLYFAICAASPIGDLRPVREEMIHSIHEWAVRAGVSVLPFGEKSVDNIAVTITKILVGHKFEMGWAYLRIRRALASLDASVMELYPTINYPGLSRDYFQDALNRAVNRAAGDIQHDGLRAVEQTVGLIQRMPDEISMQMDAIRQQQRVLGGDILNIRDMVLGVAKRIAVSAALLGTVLIWRWH